VGAGVALYASFTVFRVPEANVEAFVRVQVEAADILRGHGAIEDLTYAPVAGSAGGPPPLGSALDLAPGELLAVGLTTFLDREHHDEVMALVRADPRIAELSAELGALVDLDRCFRDDLDQVA